MYLALWLGFPGVVVKSLPFNAGDADSVPGLGRSSEERNDNPLQYSCLENLMDRGTWWATDRGVTKSWIDWFDLLTVQGTLKCLLQHHNLEALILWCSAFFMIQLSHPYMTTGKTIVLTRRTFANKVMSRFLICCLSRDITLSKH